MSTAEPDMQFSEVVDRPAEEIMTLDEPVYKTLVCFVVLYPISPLVLSFHRSVVLHKT